MLLHLCSELEGFKDIGAIEVLQLLLLVGSGGNSPRKDSKMQQPLQKQRDAFEAFAEKTSDAWDDADDDLILMANVKMSLKDVHSTAMQVNVIFFKWA